CSGNVQQNDTCHQDLLGVPRCSYANKGDAGTCTRAGDACSTSADCCNGVPCVPNPGWDGGAAQYICASTLCQPVSAGCTTNADCCPGNLCYLPPGASKGTCNPLVPPPTDAGGADSGPADGGLTTPDGGTCSLFGQVCTTTNDCCNSLPCLGGRCLTP